MHKVRSDQLEQTAYFGKVFCEKAWKWNTVGRPFDDCDLWYVWSGEGELELNRQKRSISRGCCFLFRPGDETRGEHNPQKPITVSYIHFSLPATAVEAFASFYRVRDMLTFELYLTRYVHARMEGHSGDEEEARLLLYLLLLQLERERKAEAQHPKNSEQEQDQELFTSIHEVANYVRQFPSMPHSVTKLAERARLSPRYFSRKFKEIMGRTVESYMIDMKIERAEHLLRFNGMNVSEVAAALGYDNIHYFSRQFKRYRGMSPSELRYL
ncbi:AraC family transcriptional regulator [Paenibacillus eucommiae]|uniref:AraC-like DNA-binding protein n=1 Tax=Paenibacillus eucommiae TaxID=1355755 RepID=A0ABS4J809_9BACL|nr:AraC family transcriptional regulator [Paenibacillus eucommiae]MBP1995972.1 AraC-like DNA-binding protein [Paenibacillus eucommiae]